MRKALTISVFVAGVFCFLNQAKAENVPLKKVDLDKVTWIAKPKISGAKLKIIGGTKAGLSLKALPVKTISSAELKKVKVPDLKSGLYLVDIDYIPLFTQDLLKEEGLTLNNKGELFDRDNQPSTLLVGGETGLVNEDLTIKPHVLQPGSLVTNAANLRGNRGNPFPFRCYVFHPWGLYHGGFHRWYEAGTKASAYTTDPYGNCSNTSPITNIQYLQTYAQVTGGADVDHCFNCYKIQSKDVWDVGYFWPAHGVPVTTHHAVYRDGAIYFERTAHLTW